MLCELQCNVLWAVCSVCRGKGSITQKVQELETRVLLMDHQQQIKLLLEERQWLVEQLQKDLLEDKTERDKLKQIPEKQRLEQLQVKLSVWPQEMLNCREQDPGHNHSNLHSYNHMCNLHNLRVYMTLMVIAVILTLMPQISSIHLHLENCRGVLTNFQAQNNFDVWLVDFTEATNDCMWTDVERAR